MQANEYQKRTMDTAVYPQAGSGSAIELYYLAMGVTSEAGEIAGKIKRVIRDGQLDTAGLVHEVGDVLWYAARLADALGFTLEDVMRINYAKLMKRKENNVIKGSGDSR